MRRDYIGEKTTRYVAIGLVHAFISCTDSRLDGLRSLPLRSSSLPTPDLPRRACSPPRGTPRTSCVPSRYLSPRDAWDVMGCWEDVGKQMRWDDHVDAYVHMIAYIYNMCVFQWVGALVDSIVNQESGLISV